MLRPEDRNMCWHDLSAHVTAVGSSLDALRQTGMAWNVEKREIQTCIEEDSQGNKVWVPLDTHKAIVREDTRAQLGIVTNSYTPIQNVEAFSVIDEIANNSDWKIDRVGMMGNGEKVFMIMKLSEGMRVGPDLINKYLVMFTGHDGTTSYKVMAVPVRPFCTNQLTGFLKSEAGFRIQHTKNFRDRVKIGIRTLGNIENEYALLERLYNDLLRTPMSDMDFVHFINVLIPDPEPKIDAYGKEYMPNNTRAADKRASIHNLFNHGAGHDMFKNTAWAAYNAVTEYVDHSKDWGDDWESQNRRMNNIMFNSGVKIKTKAANLLQEQYLDYA